VTRDFLTRHVARINPPAPILPKVPGSAGYTLLMRAIQQLTGYDYSRLTIRLPFHILTIPFHD
jgi:hypothetical protein